MSERLVQLMKYHDGDSATRKKVLDRIEDKKLKELLLAEELDSGVLIQKEVYRTIHEAMDPTRCMRDALPTIKTNKMYLRYPVVENGIVYAPKVPEATDIPMAETENLKFAEFRVFKYGIRPVITREMVEDAEYDVIARQLKQAGEQLENGLNLAALEMLMAEADHDNDIITEEDVATVADIGECIYKLKSKKFLPDTMVMSPLFEAMLLNDVHLLSAPYPNEKAFRAGDIGKPILGLNLFSTNVDAKNALFTFGGKNSQDPLALIYDYDQAGMILMREELRVERYSDPIKDLVGMSATMRFGVGKIRDTAISRLEHK